MDPITNDSIGGTGGTDFTFQHGTKPVTRLDCWYGRGLAGHDILRSIQVHWDREDPQDAGTTEDREELLHTSYDFTENPTVGKLELFGTFNLEHGESSRPPDDKGRVDSIRLSAPDNDEAFAAGGSWGYKNGHADDEGPEQEVGNGTLLGFYGKAGEDIDNLGTIFHQ